MPSNNRRKAQRWAPIVALVLLLLALGVQRACQPGTSGPGEQGQRGLPRQTAWLHYSRHAQCRMDCRSISRAEVEDILLKGRINYSKSEIGDRSYCQRKYALEGRTADGQRVRIVFAPCNRKITVVTVIDLDLDREQCSCP